MATFSIKTYRSSEMCSNLTRQTSSTYREGSGGMVIRWATTFSLRIIISCCMVL